MLQVASKKSTLQLVSEYWSTGNEFGLPTTALFFNIIPTAAREGSFAKILDDSEGMKASCAGILTEWENLDIDTCLLNAEKAGLSVVYWSLEGKCAGQYCSDPLDLAMEIVSEPSSALNVYAKGIIGLAHIS